MKTEDEKQPLRQDDDEVVERADKVEERHDLKKVDDSSVK